MTRRFKLLMIRLLAVVLMGGALFAPSGSGSLLAANNANAGKDTVAAQAISLSAASDNIEQIQKVTSLNVNSDANFGTSVAKSGNYMVVGAVTDDSLTVADTGAAYVFARQGAFWVEEQKLTAIGAAPFDLFGNSVAISPIFIVVGAPSSDGPQSGPALDARGSAHVFVKQGTGFWVEHQTLIASDAAPFDQFGSSVAIDGNTLVVGARSGQTAYVFTWQGGVWVEEQKLTASNTASLIAANSFVAINQDTVVVGAPSDTGSAGQEQGAAYVFVNQGGVWTEQQKLIASDGAAFDRLGNSVGIDQNTIVVGALLHGPNGKQQGAAYVFAKVGNTWMEQQKLTASDPMPFDLFGSSVSIGENTIVVGASFGDKNATANTGAAYLFARESLVWMERQKITASDAAKDDWFGFSVTTDGNEVIVGAPLDDLRGGANQGSVYAFKPREFDICIVDDQGSAVMSWNSQDGRYRICTQGKIISGQGSVAIKNGSFLLKHKTLSQSLDARYDPNLQTGSATLKKTGGLTLISISDSNIVDSNCDCLSTNQ